MFDQKRAAIAAHHTQAQEHDHQWTWNIVAFFLLLHISVISIGTLFSSPMSLLLFLGHTMIDRWTEKKTVHTRTDVSIRCVAFTEHMPVIRNASIRRCRDTAERNMFEIEIIKSFPSIDENQAKWQCGVSKWIRAHTIGGWEIMRSSIVLSQTHMRWCVVWHGTAVRTYLVNVFERR